MKINHSDYEAVIIWDAINKFVFGLSMGMIFCLVLGQIKMTHYLYLYMYLDLSCSLSAAAKCGVFKQTWLFNSGISSILMLLFMEEHIMLKFTSPTISNNVCL